MTQTKESLFVLFTAPYHQVASRVCYIALDGFPTILKSKAARFQSFADAKVFAKEHRIALNGLTYLGLEGFPDIELQSSGMFNHSESDTGIQNDNESGGCNFFGESVAQGPLAAQHPHSCHHAGTRDSTHIKQGSDTTEMVARGLSSSSHCLVCLGVQ